MNSIPDITRSYITRTPHIWPSQIEQWHTDLHFEVTIPGSISGLFGHLSQWMKILNRKPPWWFMTSLSIFFLRRFHVVFWQMLRLAIFPCTFCKGLSFPCKFCNVGESSLGPAFIGQLHLNDLPSTFAVSAVRFADGVQLLLQRALSSRLLAFPSSAWTKPRKWRLPNCRDLAFSFSSCYWGRTQ